jgi:hypothetical protein
MRPAEGVPARRHEAETGRLGRLDSLLSLIGLVEGFLFLGIGSSYDIPEVSAAGGILLGAAVLNWLVSSFYHGGRYREFPLVQQIALHVVKATLVAILIALAGLITLAIALFIALIIALASDPLYGG